MTEPRYSNASLRDARRHAGTIALTDLAQAIRETQARIKRLNPGAPTARRDQQLRGVRRAAAHIADTLGDDEAAINFLIACGYGA